MKQVCKERRDVKLCNKRKGTSGGEEIFGLATAHLGEQERTTAIQGRVERETDTEGASWCRPNGEGEHTQ